MIESPMVNHTDPFQTKARLMFSQGQMASAQDSFYARVTLTLDILALPRAMNSLLATLTTSGTLPLTFLSLRT